MLRQWYFYAWLSGDRVVEEHVHNLDVINWAIGSPPAEALAVGGRQWRVEPQFGSIYDPFGARHRYPNQAAVMSMARQIHNIEGARGCSRTAALRFRSTSFGRSRAPRALHHRHQRRCLTASGDSR